MQSRNEQLAFDEHDHQVTKVVIHKFGFFRDLLDCGEAKDHYFVADGQGQQLTLAGHKTRCVPLFPELLLYLETAFELADPGDNNVITRYQKSGRNLRTQLTRAIKRAGLKP